LRKQKFESKNRGEFSGGLAGKMMSSSAPMALPWVEKYRPHMLSEVTGNEDAVMRLKSIARDGNMPHMILTVSTFWAPGCEQARGSREG
jgi:hypothetical protein